MRAIRLYEHGDSRKMRIEASTPKCCLGANQVSVEVAYSGVNFVDTYQRSGLYPAQLPIIMGREGAGIVSALGDEVKGFKIGDRVAFLAQGTYAEFCNVDAGHCTKIPDWVHLSDASSVLLQGLTAHYLSHSAYTIKPGDNVLIHAGAGGTGALLIQMARILGAKTIITTVSSAQKALQASQAGADHCIIYTQTNFQAQVMALTHGKGCQVVYDGVGKDTWSKSLRSVTKRGHLILFGNASGRVPPINANELKQQGSVCMTRPVLRDYIHYPEEFASRCADLFKYLSSGKLKLRRHATLPLNKAPEAHQMLENREACGKVLLEVNACLDVLDEEEDQEY